MSERWKPTRGEKYWAISFDNIWESVWQDHIVDNGRWLNYQCFKTKAEAQDAAEKVKALLLSLHDNGGSLPDNGGSLPDNGGSLPDNKLPDWCKVGEWAYNMMVKRYSQVTEDNVVAGVHVLRKFILTGEIVQARLRPYNAHELKALVGKVIETEDKDSLLVTAYSVDNNVIIFDSISHDAPSLTHSKYTVNGKPCGVLEHLENGEWVE